MNMTEWIIVAALFPIAILDIYLYTDKLPGNSITQVVIKRSHQFPVIPFLLGFLMGHFYG